MIQYLLTRIHFSVVVTIITCSLHSMVYSFKVGGIGVKVHVVQTNIQERNKTSRLAIQ